MFLYFQQSSGQPRYVFDGVGEGNRPFLVQQGWHHFHIYCLFVLFSDPVLYLNDIERCMQKQRKKLTELYWPYFCLTVLAVSYVDSYRDIRQLRNHTAISADIAHLWP